MRKQKTYEQINREMWMVVGIAGALVLVAVFMPFVLTKMQAPFGWEIDFTQTGQIGDTIGGITAPFMALMAGVMVFASFRAQIQANRMQWEEITRIKNNEQLALLAKMSFKNHEESINAMERLNLHAVLIRLAKEQNPHDPATFILQKPKIEEYRKKNNRDLESILEQSHFHVAYFLNPISEIYKIADKADIEFSGSLNYLFYEYEHSKLFGLLAYIGLTITKLDEMESSGLKGDKIDFIKTHLGNLHGKLSTTLLHKSPHSKE